MENNQIQMQQKNNSAYFAFLYIVSLISLGFLAISSGMILFQLINKFVPDPLAPSYLACFQSGAIKFAISAIIVSAPIYYIAIYAINKHISKGELKKESQIRKWLTYIIILVSVLVIVGNLIAVIYNFLDGELTIRFILRTLAMIAIAGSVLSYYFIDIKKESFEKKNKTNKIYFYASISAVLIILISAFFVAESPSKSRKRKQDQQFLERMDKINRAVDSYYAAEKKLPENLAEITGKTSSQCCAEEITDEDIKEIGYNKKTETKFELCAKFQTSNKESEKCHEHWLDESWKHDAGYQCIEKEVYIFSD